jgi:tRNA(fMet)-specific endonuclease VapC
MSRYVLDTDTLSLHERGHPVLSPAIRACPQGNLSITVISVEEQLSGWYRILRRAIQPPDVARAYQRLASAVGLYSGLVILSFTEPAIARFEQLVALKLNIGRQDLRIAAIALEYGCILVTRNLRDFQRVPNLVVEDWSV